MSIEIRSACRVACDAPGCAAVCPPDGHEPGWWVEYTIAEAASVAVMVAEASEWTTVQVGSEQWRRMHYCPDHHAEVGE